MVVNLVYFRWLWVKRSKTVPMKEVRYNHESEHRYRFNRGGKLTREKENDRVNQNKSPVEWDDALSESDEVFLKEVLQKYCPWTASCGDGKNRIEITVRYRYKRSLFEKREPVQQTVISYDFSGNNQFVGQMDGFIYEEPFRRYGLHRPWRLFLFGSNASDEALDHFNSLRRGRRKVRCNVQKLSK